MDSKEIFTSDKLRLESAQIQNRISICLQAIYINNDRQALNRGHSKSYSNELFTNDETSLVRQNQCSPAFVVNTFETDQTTNDDMSNFNLITETTSVIEDEEMASKAPSTIIITVVISSVIAFVAMLSILTNIYLRNMRYKEQQKQQQRRGASLKMNSRQEFEISLNFSSQNSPVSSEICSLSTNHSFNPFTASAAAATNQQQRSFVGRVQSRSKSNDECLLNCLSLNLNNSRQQQQQQQLSSDYFEYDAFKMGELTPHAEFVFKKVNLNKKTATENIEKTINVGAESSATTSSSSEQNNTLSFERQDFDRLRNVLNWEPSYSHYEDVFDEFQRYVGGSRKHVCNRCEQQHIDLNVSNSNNVSNNQMVLNNGSILNNNFTSSSNFYDDFDKHTFV